METIRGITTEDFGVLAICAIRYCQGRKTYMPSLVRGIIKPRLAELSDKDLGVMIEDCEYQRRMQMYGDEIIDKPGWRLWEHTLVEERKRREERA